VDISQAPNKESLDFWYHEFKNHGDAKAQIMLVGNKADLEKDQETVALLEDFAKSKQIPYLEVSALTGLNVDKAMENVIDMIFDKYYKGVENTSASFLDIRKSKEYSRSIRLGESMYSQKEEDPASSSCCKSV
jgi:GTPase SAR1 family protein